MGTGREGHEKEKETPRFVIVFKIPKGSIVVHFILFFLYKLNLTNSRKYFTLLLTLRPNLLDSTFPFLSVVSVTVLAVVGLYVCKDMILKPTFSEESTYPLKPGLGSVV